MKKESIVVSEKLGMSFEDAYNRVRKMLLIKYMAIFRDNICNKCGKAITDPDDFTLGHKETWVGKRDTVQKFYKLEDIIPLHRECNEFLATERHQASKTKRG